MIETTILVALIVGITEVIKRATGLEKKYIPAIAIGIGLVIAFIGNYLTGLVGITIIQGLTAGLLSVGLFSGVKNTLGR